MNSTISLILPARRFSVIQKTVYLMSKVTKIGWGKYLINQPKSPIILLDSKHHFLRFTTFRYGSLDVLEGLLDASSPGTRKQKYKIRYAFNKTDGRETCQDINQGQGIKFRGTVSRGKKKNKKSKERNANNCFGVFFIIIIVKP